MAALLFAYVRRAFLRLARADGPPVKVRTVAKPGACHLSRPIIRLRVRSGGRLTAIWLSEESSAVRNPPD
jgi:hypothetical protein